MTNQTHKYLAKIHFPLAFVYAKSKQSITTKHKLTIFIVCTNICNLTPVYDASRTHIAQLQVKTKKICQNYDISFTKQ